MAMRQSFPYVENFYFSWYKGAKKENIEPKPFRITTNNIKYLGITLKRKFLDLSDDGKVFC